MSGIIQCFCSKGPDDPDCCVNQRLREANPPKTGAIDFWDEFDRVNK